MTTQIAIDIVTIAFSTVALVASIWCLIRDIKHRDK